MLRTSIIFSIGALFGFVLFGLIDIWTPTNSEVVGLLDILVNLVLGITIVILVQKKLSDERGIKDYFIDEINGISIEYNKFINKLINSELDPQYILEWFKTISIRIQQLEYFLNVELNIKNMENQTLNRDIHKTLTNSTVFNDSFKKSKFKLTLELKNELGEPFKNFKHSLIRTIIKINRA